MTLGCWAPSRPSRTNSPKAGSSNGTRPAPPTTDCPVGKVCFSPAPSGSSTHYTSPANKPKPPNYSNDCLLCATTSDCSAKNGTPTPGGNSATPPKRSATSRWSPAPCSYTPDAPTTATTPSPPWMTPPVPKLSRYRDCRSSQTSGAGHFDRPQATNWNVTLPRATAGTGAVTPPENTSRPARKPSGVVHNSRQCRPRPDRSRAAFSQSRSSHDSSPTTDPFARPQAADTIALPLVGRKPAHRQALLERHRPRVDQRQAPRAGLGIDVGDLELPARRRRRRVPADHTHPRHGKAVFRPDRPHVLKIRNLCPNSATTPAN